jgi:formylglycine-generating enzyme required for sulfatase activity
MGSDEGDDLNDPFHWERPRHRVRITRPFYLGVTEVTQGQYRAVTRRSPSTFKGSDDLPVENLSWLDAVNFCNALSRAEDLPLFYHVEGKKVSVPDWKGPGYRLPTEAEWEYACRAKSPALYSFGDDPARLDEYAWFRGNSKKQTHPVGQKQPNAFGLFDMHGNVWEWCSDGFDSRFYKRSPVDDPVCPFEEAEEAEFRVIRGGDWDCVPQLCRSASRSTFELGYGFGFGLRVARVRTGQ